LTSIQGISWPVFDFGIACWCSIGRWSVDDEATTKELIATNLAAYLPQPAACGRH